MCVQRDKKSSTDSNECPIIFYFCCRFKFFHIIFTTKQLPLTLQFTRVSIYSIYCFGCSVVFVFSFLSTLSLAFFIRSGCGDVGIQQCWIFTPHFPQQRKGVFDCECYCGHWSKKKKRREKKTGRSVWETKERYTLFSPKLLWMLVFELISSVEDMKILCVRPQSFLLNSHKFLLSLFLTFSVRSSGYCSVVVASHHHRWWWWWWCAPHII